MRLLINSLRITHFVERYKMSIQKIKYLFWHSPPLMWVSRKASQFKCYIWQKQWNDIKQTPNLLFKTVDDPEIMEQVIAERNSHHLNQAPVQDAGKTRRNFTKSMKLMSGRARASRR